MHAPRGLRLPAPHLRTAAGHEEEERHASWLEAFFDLVFVAAVAELAGALEPEVTAGTLARFFGLFVPVWAVWMAFSVYADRHDERRRRAPADDARARWRSASASPPACRRPSTATRRRSSIAFVALRALQLGLYARARRHVAETRALYARFLLLYGAGGALWAASLAVDGTARYVLWAAGLAVDLAGPLSESRTAQRLAVNVRHIAERFQLFLIIVLGESVAQLVSAAHDRPWSVHEGAVLAAAFAVLAGLWWVTLNAVDDVALARNPGQITRFIFVNLPLVAGIASASAGLHRAIIAADGASSIPVASRVALYGGVALALLATAALPAQDTPRRIRVAAAAAAAGLVAMGAFVRPYYLVPALAVVVLAGISAEAWRRRPAGASLAFAT